MSLFLLSCSEVREEPESPQIANNAQLERVLFLSAKNPYQIVSDIECKIIGDSLIECWIPYIIEDKVLIPDIDYIGDCLYIDGEVYNGGCINFNVPVELIIRNGTDEKKYSMYVHSFTGLSIVWIETENRVAIESKEDYLDASFKLQENIITRSSGNVLEGDIQIKGRGNSSWDSTNKKSYTIKFKKSTSLFGDEKDKSYVLLANSFDYTMIRNKLAYYMGELSNLDYTPKFRYVELFLNGVYNGTYLLGDKLKIGKHRVNVGDDGFLLEIDERAERENGVFFKVNHLEQPVNIKDPDLTRGDEDYNYVQDYFNIVEDALYSDSFTDKEKGWRKYLDETSCVDWYIINEIFKNYDALNMYTSCYLNLKRDGKLKMGPLWDFDLTLGNHPTLNSYEGVNRKFWFLQLFEDSQFAAKVKERYDYFYDQKDLLFEQINSYANYLRLSVVENDSRWHFLYNKNYYYGWDCYGNYLNEVQNLKQWLNNRMDYLKKEFCNY